VRKFIQSRYLGEMGGKKVGGRIISKVKRRFKKLDLPREG
jgi:hypothetical protein